MKLFTGLLIIGLSTIISLLIANGPTHSDPGLGFFITILWPPVVGISAGLLFLIICAISKNSKLRKISCLLFSVYVLYVGVGLYVDKGWFLVYF